MFDVQVLRHREGDLPEAALASIAGYYARVTTAARPMNRLIAVVMVATLAAIVVQIARGDDPGWAAWASLVLAAVPILVAATRTLPRAVRLGIRRDGGAVQGRLARTILHEHLVCAAAIAALLVVQLAAS